MEVKNETFMPLESKIFSRLAQRTGPSYSTITLATVPQAPAAARQSIEIS